MIDFPLFPPSLLIRAFLGLLLLLLVVGVVVVVVVVMLEVVVVRRPSFVLAHLWMRSSDFSLRRT